MFNQSQGKRRGTNQNDPRKYHRKIQLFWTNNLDGILLLFLIVE